MGDGHVLQHYLGQVDRVVGVDYNPLLLERLGSRFPSSAVTGQHLDLRGDWAVLGRESADALIASDV